MVIVSFDNWSSVVTVLAAGFVDLLMRLRADSRNEHLGSDGESGMFSWWWQTSRKVMVQIVVTVEATRL